MVTTFVCSVGSQTQGMWKFVDKAGQTDAGVRLTELEHPSLKKNAQLLREKSLDLCSLFILQITKGAVPHECWKSIRGWPSYHWTRHRLPETGRWHSHPQGFPDHRGHWAGKWVRMTLNVASLNERRPRDPSKCTLAWWTLELLYACCCSAGDSLYLCRGVSGAGGRLCGLFNIQQLLQRWGLSASWT